MTAVPNPTEAQVANATVIDSAAGAASGVSVTPSSTPTDGSIPGEGIDHSTINKLTDPAPKTGSKSEPDEAIEVINKLKDEIADLKEKISTQPQAANSTGGDKDLEKAVSTLFKGDASVEDVEASFRQLAKVAGMSDSEADSVLQRWKSNQETGGTQPTETGSNATAAPPTGGVPDDPYVRDILQREIHTLQDNEVRNLLESDPDVKAMIDLKRQSEGDEAADAAMERLRISVIQRSNAILNDRWDDDPKGVLRLSWVPEAVNKAYTDEVDFLRTVAVNPGKLPSSPSAAVPGADILSADPVEYPDPALLQDGNREQYVSQGIEMLKDRARRARAEKIKPPESKA